MVSNVDVDYVVEAVKSRYTEYLGRLSETLEVLNNEDLPLEERVAIAREDIELILIKLK